MKHITQRSNPTATLGCPDSSCVGCRTGRGMGGRCRQGNVGYEMECNLCKETAEQSNNSAARTTYIGETSRNLFSRGKEHAYKYGKNDDDSFMATHQAEAHMQQPAEFTAKVTGSYRDCLTRQVAEGVAIRRCPNRVLNSKSEWHQPSLWKVRQELELG